MFNVVLAYGADQPGKTDWTKKQEISNRNASLFSLVVRNKHASTDFHVQIFDIVNEAAIGSEVPEFDVPVYAGSYTPFAFAGGRRFKRGIFVRAVTAVGGSTLISGDDAKFTWDIMEGPIV